MQRLSAVTPHLANTSYTEGDKLFWCPEKHGSFSVQSAHKLIQHSKGSRNAGAKTSHAREEQIRMWRNVWKLPVNPNIKHFLWKCLNGWIATNKVVKRKGIIANEICFRCGLVDESQEHLFFQCTELLLI